MADVRARLPARLRHLSDETLRRRCREKGFFNLEKIEKDAPTESDRKLRHAFAKKHLHRTERGWLSYIQAVGDLKLFAWYPPKLQKRHRHLRVKKTWMKYSERFKPGFLRPKDWCTRKEWKEVQQVKVLGFTCSNGACWAHVCPKPWNNLRFAELMDQKFAPWLKRQFPGKREFRLLLDGERLLHAEKPREIFAKHGFKCLEEWPPRSPDMNPQENTWSLVDRTLRKEEPKGEAYEAFCERVARVNRKLPRGTACNLVKSLARRMQQVEKRKGGRTQY